jgi:hypothetical protein
MAQPRLTEYLLKIATDTNELDKFRKLRATPHGHAELISYLTQQPFPGLTKEQADVLDGHDSHAVVTEVLEELNRFSSRSKEYSFYGVPVTIVCEVNSVQQHQHTFDEL